MDSVQRGFLVCRCEMQMVFIGSVLRTQNMHQLLFVEHAEKIF